MSPWDILGWTLVGMVGLVGLLILAGLSFVAYLLYLHLKSKVVDLVKHYKTRHIPPLPGQVWDQGSSTLRITGVYDNGVIRIKCGNASWGDTPEEWQERMKGRRMHLVRGPTSE